MLTWVYGVCSWHVYEAQVWALMMTWARSSHQWVQLPHHQIISPYSQGHCFIYTIYTHHRLPTINNLTLSCPLFGSVLTWEYHQYYTLWYCYFLQECWSQQYNYCLVSLFTFQYGRNILYILYCHIDNNLWHSNTLLNAVDYISILN